jgi:hypothetical protein
MPLHSLELWFSSDWEAEAEPDGTSWCEPLGAEHEELVDELEIPASASEPPLEPESWNLGSLAMVAAFVPLMLGAQPALAAPPAADSVPAPTQENAAPPQASATPTEGPAEIHATASVWDGLRDHHVLLTLKDGTIFRGMVLGATSEVLTCAREGDGLMVLISINLVSTVHVEGLPTPKPPKSPPNGQGLIVFGSIATAIGGALTIAGAAVGAACATDSYYPGYICPYYSLPLGIVGVVNLAVGIPLLVTGLKKRAASRDPKNPAVSTFVLPGRSGAMAGVGLRF